MCEVVDMTCFAFFGRRGPMSCDFFFRGTLHMTRDLCIFCFFHSADDMGVAFFGHVRQLPCHLQAVYMYIMHIRSFRCRVSFLTFHTDRGVFLII